MIHLIFATNNVHKTDEVRAALGAAFSLETMKEASLDIDIPEPHPTLEANALEKARTVALLTGQPAFGEDTGLEVFALQGEPGVKSARYAGEDRSTDANIRKLLTRLGDNPDRAARFRTVMALVMDGREYCFEGICPGRILREPRGTGGFGYDPVFVPDGSELAFAEMDMEGKSRFSHRKKALDQLITFLKSIPHGQGKD
ncbi:RdgB/HAM1 family non-canonical purine NTP pyrophosphatase [Dinghuibacter silviterrae]|uniref:dITP/XTP pyrophosphatase n=1 Tax=Dinghuibacter silviterrae TaxID=1539049 RepID=A0A4R8DU41_9BACT|nr:RdgB/HAM1 family non-canonical purine NTP pyrophosphatase [Dinghuibacter silviterrae]TDX00661.1 XTP/dITP diphosphohydrolase [Dinghuibacter silviterrae]